MDLKKGYSSMLALQKNCVMCNEFQLGFTILGNRHENLILDLVHICCLLMEK
jgi:hypothetical protein